MLSGHYVAPVEDGTAIRELSHSEFTKRLYDDLKGFNRALMDAHLHLDRGEVVRTRYHLFANNEQALKAELCPVCAGRGDLDGHECNRCRRTGLRNSAGRTSTYLVANNTK